MKTPTLIMFGIAHTFLVEFIASRANNTSSYKDCILRNASSMITRNNNNESMACFTVMTEKTNWEDAMLSCNAMGGRLVEIESDAEVSLFSSHLASEGVEASWVGAYRVKHTWKWENGIDFKNSTFLEDSDVGCMAIIPHLEYSWKPTICGFNAYGYICESGLDFSGKCPAILNTYFEFSFMGDKRCFLVKNDHVSWYTADSYCRLFGLRMATFDSEFIQESLELNNPKEEGSINGYWIGLHKETWVWNSGKRVGSQYWQDNYPLGSDNCGAIKYPFLGMEKAYFLQDMACDSTLPYICQLEKESSEPSGGSLEKSLHPTAKSQSDVILFTICSFLVISLSVTIVSITCCLYYKKRSNSYRLILVRESQNGSNTTGQNNRAESSGIRERQRNYEMERLQETEITEL